MSFGLLDAFLSAVILRRDIAMGERYGYACLHRPQVWPRRPDYGQEMNCTAIYAEVAANDKRVEELGREQGWKVAQNVAAGVAGLVAPVLWFGMDWQGAAGKEASAL